MLLIVLKKKFVCLHLMFCLMQTSHTVPYVKKTNLAVKPFTSRHYKTWYALRSSLSSSDRGCVAVPVDKIVPSAVISAEPSSKYPLKCQWLKNIFPIRKVPPDETTRGSINIPSGKERASGFPVMSSGNDLKDRLVWKWPTHLKCQHLNISPLNACGASKSYQILWADVILHVNGC